MQINMDILVLKKTLTLVVIIGSIGVGDAFPSGAVLVGLHLVGSELLLLLLLLALLH